jgi:hypothetical protein
MHFSTLRHDPDSSRDLAEEIKVKLHGTSEKLRNLESSLAEEGHHNQESNDSINNPIRGQQKATKAIAQNGQQVFASIESSAGYARESKPREFTVHRTAESVNLLLDYWTTLRDHIGHPEELNEGLDERGFTSDCWNSEEHNIKPAESPETSRSTGHSSSNGEEQKVKQAPEGLPTTKKQAA